MLVNKRQQSAKLEMANPCFIAAVSDDLLQKVLSRLPAKSFAFAACVSRSWNLLCSRILSRPKILSAFSTDANKHKAAKEVLDKVLSEPIRPDFVIANITDDTFLVQTLKLIIDRVGPRVPIIVSHTFGILGNEACTDKFKEVKWGLTADDVSFVASDGVDFAILLTVGYMPGLKIDVIPVIQTEKGLLAGKGKSKKGNEAKEPKATIGAKFVMDIRTYVSMVSDQAAPVGIMLFGVENCDMKPIIEKLDYAMPAQTFILGAEKGQFTYNSVSRYEQLHRSNCRIRRFLGGLVFARDRRGTSRTGEIQFHTFISSGILPVGPKYKAASVRSSNFDSATYLTARREGQSEILDGQQLIDVINNLVENHVEIATPFIGVMKRRNCSIGLEKPRPITSLVFHEIMGGDEHSLVVEGTGIRTGDYFHFYYSNPKAALASVSNVSSQLRSLKTKMNNSVGGGKQIEFFGGFIFSCCGRGESFFGCPNTDSSPFLENFPGLPFGGIFCGGEIGRSSSCLSAEEVIERGEIMARQCLHVYSTVYLLMSYTPSC